MPKPETENIKPEIEHKVFEFVDRLKEKDENDQLVGIVFTGGLGERNFVDHHSDLDMSIFVRGEPPSFLPRFDFEISHEDHDLLFNVDQRQMEEEREREWPLTEQEAFVNGNILYEQDNAISELVAEKVEYADATVFSKMVRFSSQFDWFTNHHAPAAFDRGFHFTAHQLLSEAFEMCLDVLILANRAYLTHSKWRIVSILYHDHNRVEDVPDGIRELIEDIMRVEAFDQSTLQRRIEALNELYQKVVEVARDNYGSFPEDPWQHVLTNNLRDKRLLDTPYSEQFVDDRSFDDSEVTETVASLLDFYLVSSEEEAEEVLSQEVPSLLSSDESF